MPALASWVKAMSWALGCILLWLWCVGRGGDGREGGQVAVTNSTVLACKKCSYDDQMA